MLKLLRFWDFSEAILFSFSNVFFLQFLKTYVGENSWSPQESSEIKPNISGMALPSCVRILVSHEISIPLNQPVFHAMSDFFGKLLKCKL